MWQIHITRAISYSLMGLMFGMSIFWINNAKAQALSESAIIEVTNQKRALSNLAGYEIDSRLTQSAYAKAQDMIANDYWAHSSPSGADPWIFIAQSGYEYTRAGENLAKGFTTDAEVIQGWLESPTHRAILLDSELQNIGVAVVFAHYGGVDQYLIVVHYGKSSSNSPEPEEVFPAMPILEPATPVTNTPETQVQELKDGSTRTESITVPMSRPSITPTPTRSNNKGLELVINFLINIGLSSKYLAFSRWFD